MADFENGPSRTEQGRNYELANKLYFVSKLFEGAAFAPSILMMSPPVGVLPVVRRRMVGCRQGFAVKPFSTPLPSLCHAGPCGFVHRIVR